jgi:hypothetical protein
MYVCTYIYIDVCVYLYVYICIYLCLCVQWWEKELQRGYVVHRARYLYDQHSLLQPQITAAALTAASTLASAGIPPFMTARTSILPLPHVEVVRPPRELKGRRGGVSEAKRKAEANQREGEGEGEGAQEPSEEERDAMLKYVIQELKAELYIELLAGFHPPVVKEPPRDDFWRRYSPPTSSSEEDESFEFDDDDDDDDSSEEEEDSSEEEEEEEEEED